MIQQLVHDHTSLRLNNTNRFLPKFLVGLTVLVVGLTIVQDFLAAEINGYSFYISESILFKSVWILFVPILVFLKRKLEKEKYHTLFKTSVYGTSSVVVHLLVYFILFRLFSYAFYNDRYSLFKVVTYTFANDLYKIVLVYAIFVLSYRFYGSRLNNMEIQRLESNLEYITIHNGKRSIVLKVHDIVQITSASPYISIALADKSYLHTDTLKSLGAQLDQNKFLRVHKSSIVNMDKVAAYTSRLNGDYDLTLINGIEVRLSRTYVPRFKHLLSAHQVTA